MATRGSDGGGEGWEEAMVERKEGEGVGKESKRGGEGAVRGSRECSVSMGALSPGARNPVRQW